MQCTDWISHYDNGIYAKTLNSVGATTQPLKRIQNKCFMRTRSLRSIEPRRSFSTSLKVTADISDIVFMNQALEQAKIAYEKNEVPVGALIVFENKIICRDYNKTESLQDPTAHAEMLCIRKAAQKLENWRLVECSMFVTLEPCTMCAGAILQSRLKRVVFGANSPLFGACGSWVDLFNKNPHALHPHVEISGGVCEDESCQLLKSFYKERRIRQ